MGKQQILVTVRFTEDVDFGKGDKRQYSDSIFYTQDEYEKIKQEDIDAEKNRRVDNWKYAVQNPPAYMEPTKAELEEELARIESERAILTAKIATK